MLALVSREGRTGRAGGGSEPYLINDAAWDSRASSQGPPLSAETA